MLLNQRKAHVLFLLLALHPICSRAVNFTQCFVDVTNCAADPFSQNCTTGMNISNTTALSVLRTSRGSPIIDFLASANVVTSLSYAGCVNSCGHDEEPFNWTVFSQEFSAWLLPYLALLSQLPFGARRRTDNLMSALLTLGSPVLAGYSLFLTLLNARWANDYLFAGVDYPSAEVRQSVVRVLNNLQQVPLRIHPGESGRFESLVVHPDNDEWWIMLARELDLDFTQMWSIASATSIAWVVIAYLLTVADSFSNVADHINSNGQGTGSVWLWLLPVVIGWLILSPKCDHARVHDAYDKANKQAFVADPDDPSAAPTLVTSNFGLTIDPSPDWKLYNRNITSPDEACTPPVFNYARILPWSRVAYMVSLYYRAASRKSHRCVGVDGNQIPGYVYDDVPRESRLGNRGQIIRYCLPDDHEYPGPDILWPRGVLYNMILASVMSLQLQWGTTGAAILTVWFTPAVGFGCRSLAYLIYGMLSTAVWILLVSSSVLSYYAHHLMEDQPIPDLESDGEGSPSAISNPPQRILTPSINDSCFGFAEGASGIAIPLQDIRPSNADQEDEHVQLNTTSEEPPSPTTIKYPNPGRMHAQTIEWVADWLRWAGKLVAIVNAIGIVVISVFQYAGVYDNCYCDSSMFTWGEKSAFIVVMPIASDISLARKGWIGALALALTCCAAFVGTIYLLRDLLP